MVALRKISANFTYHLKTNGEFFRKSLEDKGVLIRKAGVGRDIHLFFTEFGREFSEKHIGPVFDMENATFESMEPSECEQLLSLTRKYVQILKKNMKQYVLEEKEF